MNRVSAIYRIAIGLALLSTSMLLLLRTMSIGPDENLATIEGRRKLCEVIAIDGSMALSRDDNDTFEAAITSIVDRYASVLSVGVRRNDGQLVMSAGAHDGQWLADRSASPTAGQVLVPLVQGTNKWGHLEVRFQPIVKPGIAGLVGDPFMQLVVFLTGANLLAFGLYLKKTLQHLDPSKVVPGRVRSALDTIAGGLAILDNQERIVLANTAFAASVGRSSEDLQGTKMSTLPWLEDEERSEAAYPWCSSDEVRTSESGETVRLLGHDGQPRTYIVNASPVMSSEQHQQGVLVSFEDVTALEQNRTELSRMLGVVRDSRDEVRKKNQQLQRLATEDPLTECLNRRSFFAVLDESWTKSQRDDLPISCLMIDIDHFKLVNDDHGHSMGDQVLKAVAATIRSSVRAIDYAGRYGGEEFCILLPTADIDEAADIAERIRGEIEALVFLDLKVTASLGVSAIRFGAGGPQEMIEQADRSLYAAKNHGRNRVVRWDEMPADAELAELEDHGDDGQKEGLRSEQFASEVPFSAVSALISALAYRDGPTAEHSRRVAGLCATVARNLLSARECYILETAALLHDIGKIGVSDSILLKPGRYTDDEREIMAAHDRMGVEIVASAFSCSMLTNTIQYHQEWYSGKQNENGLPTGRGIPVGARILSIADAFDAMVSNRTYKKTMSVEEAFAELRQYAGSQFDPEMVERFIEVIGDRSNAHMVEPVRTTRKVALRFGQQLERLADVLDRQDIAGLAVLAGRMNQIAAECDEEHLSQVAGSLQAVAADPESELIDIMSHADEMMSLCRATQTAFLDRMSNESDSGDVAGYLREPVLRSGN